MTKPTKKSLTDNASNVPVLTDIVTPGNPIPGIKIEQPRPPVKADKSPAKTPALPKDLQQTIERLTYKALYRQLAPLSKEISNEIVEIIRKQVSSKKTSDS